MKKILYVIPLTIVVLGLIFAGCAKPASSLSPNTAYYGTEASYLIVTPSTTPANFGEIQDLVDSTNDVDGEIKVKFYGLTGGDIDPTTVNATNILVEPITSGASITNLNISYDKDLKQIIISGTFSDNAAYKVTLTTGIRTIGNGQIDGNGNGKVDAAPYDNVIMEFYTGSGNSDMFDTDPSFVSSYYPTGNNNSLLTTISVAFSGNPIDTSLLNLDNIELIKEGGNTVTCSILAKGSSYLTIRPKDSLDFAAVYKVTLKTSQITDTVNNLPLVWGDYTYEANVPDMSWKFMTTGNSDHNATPFQVSSVSQVANEVKIVFSDTVDVTSFTPDRVRLIDPNNLVIPYNLRVGNDKKSIYLSLTNANTSGVYELLITYNVKSSHGWELDGNGNGIGGETGNPHLGISDDNFYTSFNVNI